jgi:glycosyltransferase involved in cell wall biosynthesis
MYVDMHASPDDRAAVRHGWGIDHDTPLIGVVGRLEPEKGHSFLLHAALLLKDSFPKARFVIVGGGPLESRLRKQCRSLGIEDRVVFAGFRRDLGRVYAAIDIPVVPSLMEPFGNVALEAMAAGKPVVASAVGGLLESIIDGETGLLVPACDPETLAGALASLMRDARFARQLGEAGRKRVAEHFTAVRVADQVEEIYEIITAQQAAPPVSKVGPEKKQEKFNEAAVDLGTV